MSINVLDTQLDCLEKQIKELNESLVGANPTAVQASATTLQRMAIELVQMANGAGRNQLTTPRGLRRLKALANGIASLRETLLRRMAYVDRALEVVMPETRSKSTYAVGSAYGQPVRQSGAFSVLAA